MAWCGRIVGMVKKEAEGNLSPEKGSAVSAATSKVEEGRQSAGFVQELLRSLKIHMLLQEGREGKSKVDVKLLEQVEVDLKSNKGEVRGKAEKLWKEIWDTHSEATTKAGEVPLETVVGRAADKLGGAKEELMAEATNIQAEVDSLISLEEGVGQGKIDGLVERMNRLAEKTGVSENVVNLEKMERRIESLKLGADINAMAASPKVRGFVVQEHREKFGLDGSDKKILEVRGKMRGMSSEETKRKWDKFVEKIDKEALADTTKELDVLTGPELIQRLQEVSEWQTNQKALTGWKLSGKLLREQSETLDFVEAQYVATLSKRLKADLEQQSGDVGAIELGEGMAVALGEVRAKPRDRYVFGEGANVESQYDNFKQKVVRESVQRTTQFEEAGRDRRQPRERPTNPMGGRAEMFELLNEDTVVKEENVRTRMGEAKAMLGQLGIDISDRDIFDRRTLEAKIKHANEVLGRLDFNNEGERTKMFKLLHDLEHLGSKKITTELGELLNTGHYTAALIKLQTYLDTVGIKEASADWEFAILLRVAKERLSFNDDLASKFDLWVEGQFIPGITDVDEDTFIKLFPKVMHPSRLNYELGTKYGNWGAMQVEIGGKKINLSTASIYQMLQSEEVARRVMDARVNGNDGVMYQLLVEKLFGPDARLDVAEMDDGLIKGETMFRILGPDGKLISQFNKKIKVNYFKVMEGSSEIDYSEELDVKDLLHQASQMAKYAKKIWWWSGDWERFLSDFDNDHLRQSNKRLLSIGSAIRDYGLDYAKFHPVFEELLKAGVLLPPWAVYKKSDMLGKNIKHLFVDNHISDLDRATKVAKALEKMALRTVKMSETGNEYVTGMRSKEEVRLMASLPKTEEEAWNWWLGTQRRIKRPENSLRSFSEIQVYRNLPEERRDKDQMAWTVQFEEVMGLMDELGEARRGLDNLVMSKKEIGQLMKIQAYHDHGEYIPGDESLDAYLKTFEFNSVFNYDESEKGSDPIDYPGYFSIKKELVGKLSKMMKGGMPSSELIMEVFNDFTKYCNPQEDKVKWFDDFMKILIKHRTWQWGEYDIAMTDREAFLDLQRRAKLHGFKEPEGKPPIGYQIATYKLVDERGDTWNVKGRDGQRVTLKRKTRGCESWTRDKIPMLRLSDVEPMLRFMSASGMLPTHETAEDLMGEAFGFGKPMAAFEKMYTARTGEPLPKWMKTSTRLANKLAYLVRKHPLFDDPVWAFWSIANEIWTYAGEVSKEVAEKATK